MKEVFICEGLRTATGKFGGSLSKIQSPIMGGVLLKALVEKAKLPTDSVDEVICGIHFQAGIKANGARQVAIYGGLPVSTPAFTPNKNCGTALKAINLAAQSIQVGDNGLVIAGGTETMSAIPYVLSDARFGYRMGNGEIKDSMMYDGLIDPFCNYHMGITAENLATKYNISREEQDEFALASHMKAAKAWADGKYKDDIMPYTIKTRKSETVFDTDETFDSELTKEKLGAMRPAFKKDGSVTSGNSSPINDGAALVVMANREKMNEYSLKPMAKYIASSSAAVDPSIMGYGPIPAVAKLLKKTGLKKEDIGLWELNEAFASQALTCTNELGLNPDLVNVNGGAIALGHAVGCTGSRISITLIQEMRRRGVKYGIASLCIGGGQGIATLYELCD